MQEVEQCMEQLPKVRKENQLQKQLKDFAFFASLRLCVFASLR
jgi:hypothetical protein